MNFTKFFISKQNLLKKCILHQPNKVISFSSICPRPAPPKFTVTLMNSATTMGEALALMLKQNQLIKVLRLYDDRGDTIGIGMDLSDIDTSTKIEAYSGEGSLKDALKETDIVINCGGYSSNPFESYQEVFERNADDVRRTAIYLTEFNRDAIFCIARPPVESLVPMVFEEYRKAGVRVPEIKIIGVSNYLSMRANHYISKLMKVNAFYVTCPVIGGVSPETVIAVISGSNPGKKLTNPRTLAVLQDGIAYSEEEVLSIKVRENGGSVAHAPAVATYRLINNVLKGLRGDHDAYDCAFLRQEGHLKKFLPYMASIVKFGKYGVQTTHMPEIIGLEMHRLKHIYSILRAYIHLGESFVHGLPIGSSRKSQCARPCIITKVKTEKDMKEPLNVKINDPGAYKRCENLQEKRPTEYCEKC